MSEVQQAFSRFQKARSRDEADTYIAELAKAARQNPHEVIALFHTTKKNQFALVWCLHGLTDDAVIELYKRALNEKEKYVRWAAIEGLKYSSQPTLIPTFIAALNDRSPSVQGVAVEWLKTHGDSRAVGPLERLSKLPSLIKNSPGITKQAIEAVRLIREKAG